MRVTSLARIAAADMGVLSSSDDVAEPNPTPLGEGGSHPALLVSGLGQEFHPSVIFLGVLQAFVGPRNAYTTLNYEQISIPLWVASFFAQQQQIGFSILRIKNAKMVSHSPVPRDFR